MMTYTQSITLFFIQQGIFVNKVMGHVNAVIHISMSPLTFEGMRNKSSFCNYFKDLRALTVLII